MHNLRRLGCGKIPAPSNQSCIIQGVASGHKERQGREDAEGDGDRSLAGGRSRTKEAMNRHRSLKVISFAEDEKCRTHNFNLQ